MKILPNRISYAKKSEPMNHSANNQIKMNLKISIVTVSYNSEEYIESAIQSVLSQTYDNIEYIIIDGGSTDNTGSILNKYKKNIGIIISEPDEGIYDAMNKGYRLASGDIIGILNSDDFFYSKTTVSEIANVFNAFGVDSVHGDIRFIHPGNMQKTVRYYSSSWFSPWLFRFGMMPPHASFYARKEVFDKYGLYKTNYRMAGDFELLLRLLYVKKISTKYMDKCIVTMRTGGLSTNSLNGKKLLNQESIKACKENQVYTNYVFLLIKYLVKTIELFLHKIKGMT
jgi:glycosyltransferase involved in cell wall biosynthesis